MRTWPRGGACTNLRAEPTSAQSALWQRRSLRRLARAALLHMCSAACRLTSDGQLPRSSGLSAERDLHSALHGAAHPESNLNVRGTRRPRCCLCYLCLQAQSRSDACQGQLHGSGGVARVLHCRFQLVRAQARAGSANARALLQHSAEGPGTLRQLAARVQRTRGQIACESYRVEECPGILATPFRAPCARDQVVPGAQAQSDELTRLLTLCCAV